MSESSDHAEPGRPEEGPDRAAEPTDAAEAPPRDDRPRRPARVRVADPQHWLDLCA
jgi:hypothetical protein